MAENINQTNDGITNPPGSNPQVAQMKKQAAADAGKVKTAAAEFEEFDETLLSGKNISGEKLSLLQDLMLNVYIELGRTQMKVKDILELERGYVLELDKMASEPVDIYINNKKIAEGEVVVIDKHFGIRITNLVDTGKRLDSI